MSRVGVWIIGDQVCRQASSLAGVDRQTPIVFVESRDFCLRRPYHWQKLVLIFSAMRHHARELQNAGRPVHYFHGAADFASALRQFVAGTGIDTLRVMEPNDPGRLGPPGEMERLIGCRVEVTPNNQFLCDDPWFDQWAQRRSTLVMEHFYREMRRMLDVLLDRDGQPLGGQWNLDKLNRRSSIPADLPIPEPFAVAPDAITCQAIDDVHAWFGDRCFGATSPAQMRQLFTWPVTPADADAALDDFLQRRLANFGPYEDAMTGRSWSLWHSHLSVPMNCGLLHPRDIVERTLAYALPRVKRGSLPLNSVEGFIRQVIGWREYMRHVYRREAARNDAAPYAQRNALHADHPLPDFYWTGQTDMACVRDCLRPVIERGYCHHIPRLMVLANFALLHGISPQQVNEWFIYAYADGYEWITTPNVIGMGLYADGGIVATKPYAAGGAYINRMSDYCRTCRYRPDQATGPDACPFTRAYWPFVHRHQRMLATNPRTSLMVRSLSRLSASELTARQQQSRAWLQSIETYRPSG